MENKTLITILALIIIVAAVFIFGMETQTPTEGPEGDGRNSDKIIAVSLTVFSDNKVEENRIALTDGRPTHESVLSGKTGDYKLRIIDSDGNIVWSNPFSINFEYEGPKVAGEEHSGVDYEKRNLSVKIPYEEKMGKIELHHKNSLIYSATLPKEEVDR